MIKFWLFIIFLLTNLSVYGQNNIIDDKVEVKLYNAPVYKQFDKQNPYQDIIAHTKHPERLNQFRDNRVTYSHEMTHELNSQFSTLTKQAMYLTNGKYASIIDPGVDVSEIDRLLPPELKKDHLYKVYFVDQVTQNRKFRFAALKNKYLGTLFLFDEFSAYINGSFIKEQYKLDSDESEIENAYKFALYCGYVIYYLDSKQIECDDQILASYQYQYYRLKSLRSDEKYRRILSESEISNFLKKILDI
jgi:hypothetical protein